MAQRLGRSPRDAQGDVHELETIGFFGSLHLGESRENVNSAGSTRWRPSGPLG